MKLKSLLISFFLVVFSTTVLAQQHRLMGVWQQQSMDSKGPQGNHLINLPVWKIIEGDGTYCTFMITNREAYTVKVHEGTYAITSDSTFTEKVEQHMLKPQLNGLLNVITYQFFSDDQLCISYQLPGADKPNIEIWRRVKLEAPSHRRKFRGPDAEDIED